MLSEAVEVVHNEGTPFYSLVHPTRRLRDLAVWQVLRRNSLLVALPAILAVGWIDYVTGPDVALSLVYLIPIVLVAWFTGVAEAIISAFMASICWFAADFAWHGDQMNVMAWNGFTRLVIFAGTAYLVDRIHIDRTQLQALNGALQLAFEREAMLARTDAVTGLANARAFTEHLKRESARARRDNTALSLLFVDLDDFKSINDTYGHIEGDAVLKQVGQAITAEVRASDLVARLGGDEFVILLWRSAGGDSGVVAGRIAQRIAAIGAAYPLTSLGASIGWSHFDQPPEDVGAMIRAADRSMYRHKAEKHAGDPVAGSR